MAKFKSDEEILLLRESGRRLAHVIQEVKKATIPGVSTGELDQLAYRLIKEMGDEAPFFNYQPAGASKPFPAAICISVNDEIVHGIPSFERIIEEGDIVSLDLGVSHKGMITDSAITIAVGKVTQKISTLLTETERALYEGINAVRVGGRIGDISAAIEKVATKNSYGIVRELGGHGVGHKVHEDPHIPNYGHKGNGPLLKKNMVLAIEPMFMLGKENILLLPDGYTIVTEDGSHSAHFEHTIVITDKGPEIITLSD